MKEPKQQNLPGVIKETPLSKACDQFVEILEQFDGLKNEKETISEHILIEMELSGRMDICIEHGGIGYRFSIDRGRKKLRVQRMSPKIDKSFGQNR